jgi:pimeloyl-ACP methyl ester carboxylesterase
MMTARLHDDAFLDVSVRGDGPAVLIPVSTAVTDPQTAERLRAWGADPDLGHTLATGLAAAGFRVITADYEGHLGDHPKPHTLTPAAVAADLLAVADAAGADRFAYYGYSWLALAGLQLAIRTDRLTALAMGGYPPLGGPYAAMLTVTRAAHRMALARRDRPPAAPAEVQPGDWDSAEVTRTPEQTGQYVTLYEALQTFDERAALDRLGMPRLAFAGENDTIAYGPQWDDARVDIAGPLRRHRDELTGRGWTVQLIPDTDHMSAMHANRVLAILGPWLAATMARSAGGPARA